MPEDLNHPSLRHESSRPLRVLHVLHSISPVCGGPVENLWSLLKAAKMSGIDAAVVTTNHNGPNRLSAVPLDRFVEVKGFAVRYFPCQLNFYAMSIPMLRWLLTNVCNYDLVHVHALFSFAPVVAAWCARRAGIPYILSPHGVLNVWGRENRRPVLKRSSIRYVEGPLLQDAACVQFTSRPELEEFRLLGIKAATEVIPLAMSLEYGTPKQDFTPSPELIALRNRPVVLFLARIHPIKNLDMLLHAFAGVIQRHPRAILVVAGDGESNLVAGLRQLAADLGIAQHTRWTGFADRSLKLWLLGVANVFVLPSWSENFGLAAAEAMAAGLPVVVTHGAGIADLVATHDCGLVTECSKEALQQAIELLLNDEATRARMGLAGKEAARSELSIEVYADRVQRMYKAAVAPTARAIA